jgi:uncharacterized protein (DUF697 family)
LLLVNEKPPAMRGFIGGAAAASWADAFGFALTKAIGFAYFQKQNATLVFARR